MLKTKKNRVLKIRTENRCRRAESAYSRANGSPNPRLIILFRFWLLAGSERIDILSKAVTLVGENLLGGRCVYPGST